jgi:hypothetical protein
VADRFGDDAGMCLGYKKVTGGRGHASRSGVSCREVPTPAAGVGDGAGQLDVGSCFLEAPEAIAGLGQQGVRLSDVQHLPGLRPAGRQRQVVVGTGEVVAPAPGHTSGHELVELHGLGWGGPYQGHGLSALTVSGLAHLLSHQAYVGIVEWDGIEYPASHEPIVERATLDKVQELLAAQAMRGTQERRHHHYLKGLLVCGVRGRRLFIQHSKGIYIYFYCLGQKDRRNGTGCQERYIAADQLEAEVEDLYARVEVPDDWAAGHREAIAAEVATHHEDTTAERDLLAHRREHAEAERFKLMEAYYANAIDVQMLRHEQERIGAELRAIESRQAVLDASLEEWQEVMDLALEFSTRCATACRRGGDRTRRLFNTAILDEVHVRDGHVGEVAHKEPFDLLFSMPKFEYGDLVGREGLEPPTPCASCKCASNCANGPGPQHYPPGGPKRTLPRHLLQLQMKSDR